MRAAILGLYMRSHMAGNGVPCEEHGYYNICLAVKKAMKASCAKNGTGMVRLLIVDEDPVVCKGLLMLFEAEKDLFVIDVVLDHAVVAERVKELCPDVVLMDVEMRHIDGVEAVCELHIVCPETPLVVLSVNDDPITRARVIDAGAAGFVSKSMPAEILLTTVREVAHRLGCGSIRPAGKPIS